MRVKLNASKFSTDVVPEDTYLATPMKTSKKTSESGNRVGYFTFRILEGDMQGRTVTGNVTVTEDSLWKANSLYKACQGEDMPDGQEFENEDEFLDWLFQEINGVQLLVKVTHDNYQGQTRAQCEYLPAE